jgi:molecular chaperone GrpE
VDGSGAGAARDPEQDAHKAEIEALKKEKADLHERLLRTAADFDNFRKRTRREIDEAKLRGKDDTLRELLPVFDNLERAVRASGDASEVGAVVEGVRMVLKLFEDTAQRMGLSRVPTVGERFDPATHEAIQQAESSEHVPGTIIQEVAPGYLFGKRLLRAAMVIVARRPADAKPAKNDDAPKGDATNDDAPGDTSGAGAAKANGENGGAGEGGSQSSPPGASGAARAEGTSP